jgi:hypothetical protein
VLAAVAIPKKVIVNRLESLKHTKLKYLFLACIILPSFFSRKILQYELESFIKVSDWALWEYYLSVNRYCTAVQEVAYHAAVQFGHTHEKIIHIIAMIFEFDTAYRYRVQDLAGELNAANFEKKPFRELLRIFSIVSRRERSGGINWNKWFLFAIPCGLILVFKPRIKQAVVQLFRAIDWEKVRLDETDWYFVCAKVDYDYGGVSLPHRMAQRAAMNQGKSWAEIKALA